MLSAKLLLLGLAAAIAAIVPVPASAQMPARRALTPHETRAAVVDHGYGASELSAWSDGTVTFDVYDFGSPSLRVLVFVDSTSAARHAQAIGQGSRASAWVGNVALVPVTDDAALECAPDQVFYGDVAASPPPAGPPARVDHRILNLLGTL
jgi:hypothetical protein